MAILNVLLVLGTAMVWRVPGSTPGSCTSRHVPPLNYISNDEWHCEQVKSLLFLTFTDTCSRVCSSPSFLSFLSFCRRVRSGSGMSVISSSSVDQRLPEEPASEDEQQLEKKLPGERPTADWLMHGRNGNKLSFWHLAVSSAAHRQETDTFGTTVEQWDCCLLC